MVNAKTLALIIIIITAIVGIAVLVTGTNTATSLSQKVPGCSTTARAQLSGSFVINDAGILTIKPEVTKLNSISIRPVPLSITGFLGSTQDVAYEVSLKDSFQNNKLGSPYEGNGVISKKGEPNPFSILYEAPYNKCSGRLEDQQLTLTVEVTEVGNIPIIQGNDENSKSFTCTITGGQIRC